MQLQKMSFKSNSQTQSQQNNIEVPSPALNKQISSFFPKSITRDTINIPARIDKKSSESFFDKISLGILATATLTGIGLFAFRKNIAKNILKNSSYSSLKQIKIKDDTIEQAVSYITHNYALLGSKTKEELLELSKYANMI